MELLEVDGPFADGDEFDGSAGDLVHGERGAASGVAVHLGEDDAGDAECLVEVLGDGDGLLSECGVADEEDFLWVEALLDLYELLDEGVVDLESSGGVDDEDVGVLDASLHECGLGDLRDVLGESFGEDGDVEFVGEDFELVDGGGSLEVAGGEHDALLELVAEVQGELGGGGGLAGAMESAEHDDGGRALEVEWRGVFAEECDELVVDDFDDLLSGCDALHDRLAEALGADIGDEFLDDGVVDVRIEECGADFGHGVGEVAERLLKTVSEVVEHGQSGRRRVGGRCGREWRCGSRVCGGAQMMAAPSAASQIMACVSSPVRSL